MTTQAALSLVTTPAPRPTGRVRCIAVSGRRAGRLPPGAPDVVRQAIGQLVALYPGALWLVGGAVGADQIAAGVLLDQGQAVRLVLPFHPALQARRWAPAHRQVLLDHVTRAAGVEVVANDYDVTAYHERNRRLVDRADLLVAFYDGRPSGGTYNTIQMAGRRKVPTLIWWV